jgi:adenylosuccinate synthase
VGIKSFDKLPGNAQKYLRRLESLVEAPVALISTGADREETIVLKHPFE